MLSSKRVIVASLMGIVTGFICVAFASGGPASPPAPVLYQIVFTRALAGFAIGISILRMGHWLIHGAVLGFLFSLPLAFSNLMAPDSAEFSRSSMFIAAVVMGLIYGVLVEFVTTVLFKARMPVKLKA
jgi:hypothetical protein